MPKLIKSGLEAKWIKDIWNRRQGNWINRLEKMKNLFLEELFMKRELL